MLANHPIILAMKTRYEELEADELGDYYHVFAIDHTGHEGQGQFSQLILTGMDEFATQVFFADDFGQLFPGKVVVCDVVFLQKLLRLGDNAEMLENLGQGFDTCQIFLHIVCLIIHYFYFTASMGVIIY